MVTIKDLAAACGISVTTVSKAMNNYSDVSPTTKQLVMDKAREMGYLPNAQARALKTNRTYCLGMLMVDEDNVGLTHGYFSQILESFKKEAEKSGYDITFIGHQVGGVTTTYLEHCMHKNVDGVMIACEQFSNNQIIELLNSRLPMVTIDYTYPGKSSVISANAQGMTELVNYAASLGHKHIAYIHGQQTEVTNVRVGSFFKAMSDLGYRVSPQYIVPGRYCGIDITAEATKKLLALSDPPTCILCSDDTAALGAIDAARELGLKVPDDISIIGYDGLLIAQHLTPRLTTLKQDTNSIGIEAAKELIYQIEHPKEWQQRDLYIPGKLIHGESVCDIRKA